VTSKTPARWHWGEPLDPIHRLLARGGVLAIPTESSYGLAVDPRSSSGVETIFRFKQREARKPLPVVVGGTHHLEQLGVEPGDERLLALAGFWPAPLTVVVPIAADLPAAAGTRSVGVRIPDHEQLRRLLLELDHGLTATSANISGRPPVLDPAELVGLLSGWDALIIDDGVLPGGEPSTVVALTAAGLALLRQGSYPWEAVSELEISATDAEILVDESS
jgi:L-threonylcarbamoyladenylate synthase